MTGSFSHEPFLKDTGGYQHYLFKALQTRLARALPEIQWKARFYYGAEPFVAGLSIVRADALVFRISGTCTLSNEAWERAEAEGIAHVLDELTRHLLDTRRFLPEGNHKLTTAVKGERTSIALEGTRLMGFDFSYNTLLQNLATAEGAPLPPAEPEWLLEASKARLLRNFSDERTQALVSEARDILNRAQGISITL